MIERTKGKKSVYKFALKIRMSKVGNVSMLDRFESISLEK